MTDLAESFLAEVTAVQLKHRNIRAVGVKRTWRLHCEMSAFDPKRTQGPFSVI